ncbi:MAG: D-alanyl-D-alanine carboxypeptidase family protein [Oscillospiraceae bacterium]|nr:D-alanyl-D-alanine carboxypeptidase family protein [Oscillospiraceae bacterium]
MNIRKITVKTFPLILAVLFLFCVPASAGDIPTYYEWCDMTELTGIAASEEQSDGELTADNDSDIVSKSAEPTSVPVSVKCPSAILVHADTGTVLYEKNADERMPIASVTKIMTLLLVMEALDDGILKYEDMITVSDKAASMGGSQTFLSSGEQMSAHDMIKSIAMASANDAALALAEHIAGSEEAFVERMNAKAAALGMTNTSFINVTGLDDNEVHLSSARDVAKMSCELLKHSKILEFTTLWMDSIRGGKFGLVNTNKLVRFYKDTTGLKTGYTSKSKFCVSASAKKNGLHLIAVVLHGETSDERFSDAKEMLNYGFANYAVFKPEGIELPQTKVWGGITDSIKPEALFGGLLCKKSDISKITCRTEMSHELTAPVDKGQIIGRVIYESEGKIIYEAPIVSADSVRKLSFWEIFKELIKSSV